MVSQEYVWFSIKNKVKIAMPFKVTFLPNIFTLKIVLLIYNYFILIIAYFTLDVF